MTFSIEQIIGAIGSLVVAVVGFIFQGFSKRLDYVEEKQANHELHVATNYVRDEDLKDALKPMFHKLDRMESKIDDTNFKLANKQDRP